MPLAVALEAFDGDGGETGAVNGDENEQGTPDAAPLKASKPP